MRLTSVAVAIRSLQLREIARDALVDALKAPLHLGLGEVLVPRVDRLELRSVNGHACHAQQIELAAQHDELPARLTNGRAVILAEVGDGLKIRCEPPGQPDHLDVALALSLQPPARRHAVEVAVDVELEHHLRMIAGPADIKRLNVEAKPIEVDPVDK